MAVSVDRATTTPANDQFETPATGWGLNAALRGVETGGSAGRLEWEFGADARLAEGETRERFRYMNGAFTRDRIAGGETAVRFDGVRGAAKPPVRSRSRSRPPARRGSRGSP